MLSVVEFHGVSYEQNMLVKEGNQKPAIPSMGEYGSRRKGAHLSSSKTWGYMAEDMTSR